MDIDSARTVRIHARIIRSNAFLRKVYETFYNRLYKALNVIPVKAGIQTINFNTKRNNLRLDLPIRGLTPSFRRDDKKNLKEKKEMIIVELGSGGGFMRGIIPNVITSDIVRGPGIDKVFSAEKMPFKNRSIDAFVMLNVFHHIKDAQKALSEMQRCLKGGGKIIMIEPWNTPFSRFIYQHFHHELFDPQGGWKVDQKGRLSGANGALPWILFKRDKQLFIQKFPLLKIRNIQPHTPLLYLLSGGLSRPPLFLTWTFSVFKGVESILTPLFPFTALFATIELQKIR